MSAIEKSEPAKSGQNPPPARTPARSGERVLSVVRNKDERSLHLSPILRQIKDDGPAVIDGEVVKDAAANPKLAKPATSPDPKAAPAAPAPVIQPLLAEKQIKVLLGFCAALTLGLCCNLYFSWQQQARLETVEALLFTLVAER